MLIAKIKKDGTVELVGEQGATWELPIECYSDKLKTIPRPLTGYLARGAYKKSYKKDTPVQLTFTCVVLPYNASTNPYTNKIKISALPAESSAITEFFGVYVIEVYSGTDNVVRAMYGPMKVLPKV